MSGAVPIFSNDRELSRMKTATPQSRVAENETGRPGKHKRCGLEDSLQNGMKEPEPSTAGFLIEPERVSPGMCRRASAKKPVIPDPTAKRDRDIACCQGATPDHFTLRCVIPTAPHQIDPVLHCRRNSLIHSRGLRRRDCRIGGGQPTDPPSAFRTT